MLKQLKEAIIEKETNRVVSLLLYLFDIFVAAISYLFYLALMELPKPLLSILVILLCITGILQLARIFSLKNKIKTKLFPYFNVLWDKLKNPYCPNCQILLTNYNYSPETAIKPHFRCVKCKSIVTMHKNGEKLTIEEAKGLLPNIVGEYP